jgi:carbonic anhydrase
MHPTSQLPVLQIFWVTFQETKEPNIALQPLLESMSEVSHAEGITHKLSEHLTLQNLLPHEMNYFYRYAGSLTTPNCEESVLWTVLAQLVPVGEQQVIFQQTRRKLLLIHSIQNTRLIQCLH